MASTILRIPENDLAHCQWMASFSLTEWYNWHKPQMQVSLITKDRPKSLSRLLASLSQAAFFGDKVDVRIHIEQDCDRETLALFDRFSWPHGSVYVQHRIIQGGLLPAVVESWYPSSNDSYGLLLEDDVELSPMFYAWSKMALLKYRYGRLVDRSDLLFGISLYQQKNTELQIDGRRPFDARSLFHTLHLDFPSTPYLSQIPCSWGAVYFPEHWREFHNYLAFRLSEYVFSIEQNIVPDLRSNRWLRSWKKYFIEFVYLRGYVMLYPNYADFVSLSTNHLEVGSHVRATSMEKRDLFVLPLMVRDGERLLELPNHCLPGWDSLPTLNLTGALVSSDDIVRIGRERRLQLTGCRDSPSVYDARELLCVMTINSNVSPREGGSLWLDVLQNRT
ncbi:hypothetical protein FISHEDRAFT_52978 [Fistulina hepatica ATCC 64428]|nr:hypothetical protein FISHEDRAFT_52978 [Fistulina hepatica ATCC 64428]